jgi:hypothetical protein
MLTADLIVVDNHASLTLPGSLGSKTYAQVSDESPQNGTLRRIAATALTTPQEISIIHQISGKGDLARVRSLIRHRYTNFAYIDTKGNFSSMSASIVLDRPLSTAEGITSTICKDSVGALLDVILTSGQLDKILNREA